MKPFLKWPGGKHRVVHRIRERLPQGRRLVEPFVGSGAVFLNTAYPTAWLADINADLIALYQAVQTTGPDFIEAARPFFTPENNRPDRYYEHRARFNACADPWERSTLFLYLNRHGYNGLVRYNSAGHFNVPFGRYTRPYFPETELAAFAAASQRAVFQCADFRAVMEAAEPGDVIYCDPPYIPLSATANFTDYAGGGFGPQDQQDLAALARRLATRDIPVLISNHETAWSVELYSGAQLDRFPVARFISCDGNHRDPARELLALFGGAE